MRRPKYRFRASRKKRGKFVYRLLGLGLLVFLGWLWYQHAKRQQPKANSKPVAAVPALTNVVRQLPPTPTPVASTNGFPRPVRNVFEAQVALLQHGISSGSIDGVIGSQTRAAIAAFQLQEKLPATGELDSNTTTRLLLPNEPLTSYTVTPADLARLQPVSSTWLGKSQQTALDYENILELVAEKFFAHPNFIRRLNASVDWTNVAAGTVLEVPNATYPPPPSHAAFVIIHLSGKILEAFDGATNLLAHFPCSIAQRVEKRPVGELHVAVVVPNPNYTFDPEIFPESPEAQQLKHKIIIPPGPNNPVGVAWIGLDRPGYGIHGTPSPEQVGRTESHGCFRLANWNAEFLLRLISVGTPVYVEE